MYRHHNPAWDKNFQTHCWKVMNNMLVCDSCGVFALGEPLQNYYISNVNCNIYDLLVLSCKEFIMAQILE